MKEDVFVSVDIEADGPIPGENSMISLGAVVAGRAEATFYREIRPISERFVPEALAVSGLDRDKLLREGAEPEAAMRAFAAWLGEVSPGRRPVFVGFNATFDWMFVSWYFHRFTGKNPFGISGLDIKAYYMGALGKKAWADTAKRNMEKRFLSDAPHTHHALDDAREQAEVFLQIKAYAEGLRASDAGFRALIETWPEMIFVHGAGRVVYVNAAAAAGLEYGGPGEILGGEIMELVHADDHAAFAARIDLMTRTAEPAPSQELHLLRKGGVPVATELVSVPLVFNGEPAIVSVARDITERKRMQAHLLQSDRLVALGTLAGGVAHEINNPLTYVMGNADLVSRLLQASADECRGVEMVSGAAMARALDQLRTTLEVARDGAERVRRIVRDLTTFAQSETDRRTLLDVRAVLDPVINLVSNEIRQRARLVRDLGDVPLVDANEALLGQVFMNLLINAAHAIPEGHADEQEIRIATSTDGAGRAIVEVRDTGSGIPEDLKDRIFEPFFTTQPVGIGTGLGLSICHGTITALGGEISVTSAPGAGATFRVAIPAAVLAQRKAAAHSPGVTPAAPPVARRARVLLVDDEPMILESLKRALGRHDVHVTTSAREALARILVGERFDAILCDLLLPEMSGMDLGDELSRAVPEQAARIVFMTGGAFTARAREFLGRVSNPCIEKPFDRGRLHALIQDLVDKSD